jgi:hypothetical protein
MDQLVTLYHGGSVVIDDYENVQFVGMQRVPIIFMARLPFIELVAWPREELNCDTNCNILCFYVL